MSLNGNGAMSFSSLKAQLGFHLRTAIRRRGGKGRPLTTGLPAMSLHPQHRERLGLPVGEVGV